MGADVCIDAVGCEAAGDALQTVTGRKLMCRRGPTGNLIPIGNVVNKGITIRANQASVKRLLPRLIEHIQAGRLDPKAIITHRIPLEEVGDAYHIFSAKLDNCIKTVLIPPSARK
ncbi:threonine dehydrogenase-like Zn-dependent dehydrogenase [Dyadobacter arcticus]|uniref:Threonine dehydrogenase-like Zn-dependent dehydrogenase n=1 Tax=Dyadobacter arcticus TaxID=1078754 RepID=A0ABX0UKK4_9BACT|nr:threonine dehydrogenase-like Zn-dependent dehydrogenase [Dyadobacter arcticus]